MQFISKYANYRLILKPSRVKEVEGQRMIEPGVSVEFIGGRFETEDKDLIAQLKQTRAYGVDFWSAEVGEASTPTDEGVKDLNEQRSVTEEIASTCEWCGGKYKSAFGLQAHQRACPKRPS